MLSGEEREVGASVVLDGPVVGTEDERVAKLEVASTPERDVVCRAVDEDADAVVSVRTVWVADTAFDTLEQMP